MNRLLIVVFMLSCGYNLVSAQQTEVTTVIRDWDSAQNIDHLNDNYNLDDVSMDDVIFIRENGTADQLMQTSSVSSSSSSVGGAATSGVSEIAQPMTAPEPVQVNTPAPKPATVVATSNTSSASSSSSSTSSYRKTSPSKKRTKMKRVKLKKKKNKRYKGKSCFRF